MITDRHGNRLHGANATAAAGRLDWHNAEYPHDLLAIQAGHLVDFFRANSRSLRDRIAREPEWSSEDNVFKVHNWWHRALWHLDLGQIDEVLALYDGPIRGQRSTVALDLVDAAALLWRIELCGHSVGERWNELADSWRPQADGGYPFNDWHAAMSAAGAGRPELVDELSRGLQVAGSAADSEAGHCARETGLTLVTGFAAFRSGDYQRAVDCLLGIRHMANRFGGSHAQRDVIDWTVAEAAARGGMRNLAEALANERLALKPHSPVNRVFLQRVTGLQQVYPATAFLSRQQH